MRKVLLTLAAVFTFTAMTQAQTQKGFWLLGGSAGFSSSKTGDAKETDLSFSPNAGYFIKDNLAIGGRLGFSSQKPDGGETTSSFSFAPFVRYYFLSLGSNVKLMGDASFGFGSVKTTSSQSFTAWSIAAGPAVFLNEHTALEFTLGYNSVKFKDAPDATNSFGVNVGFQIHFGNAKK